MFTRLRTALSCLLVVLAASGALRPCQAQSVVLAWDSGDGRLLLGGRGCVACHQAGPHKVKPGTPMTEGLRGLAGEQRAAAVEDLVVDPDGPRSGLVCKSCQGEFGPDDI